MSDPFELVCDFLETAEKKLVKGKSNQVWIGSNFFPTAIRLFLCPQKLDVWKPFEHFVQLLCTTSVRYLLNECRAKVLNGPLLREKSTEGTWAVHTGFPPSQEPKWQTLSFLLTGGSPYPGLPPADIYQFIMEGNRMDQPVDCPDDM